MNINIFQIILITAYAFWTIIDAISFDLALSKPVVSGLVVGTILGDPITGLKIGGALQLLILGVGTYGGASIPDYNTSAMIATICVVAGKLDETAGMLIAVPLGLLLVNLDILARFSNSYFMQKADQYADAADLDSANRMNLMGIIPWGLSRALPVLVFLLVGNKIVEPMNQFLQSSEWLTTAFKVVAGMLPAVGFAILLRFINTKQYISYLMIGFALAAYLNVPILGVAIFGLAMAILVYRQRSEAVPAVAATMGGDNDDE